MTKSRRRSIPPYRPSQSTMILGAVVLGAVIASALFILIKSVRHHHVERDMALDTPAAAASGSPGDEAVAPSAEDRKGYLADTSFAPAQFLLPPPAAGSAEALADKQIFHATRELKGSARWKLAHDDDDQTVPGTLSAFSCAVGVQLSRTSSPVLATMLDDMYPDEDRELTAAKQAYPRARPFTSESGDICVARTAELAKSPDYPSGHATWGWLSALLLAEIAPDHADDILARGRAYGESRVICGVHNASSIEAGRINGAALAAALHSSRGFLTDLNLARSELASLRKSGQAPDPAQCAALKGLVQTRYY